MSVFLKTIFLILLTTTSIATTFSSDEIPFFLEEKRLSGELKSDFAEIDPRFSLKLFRFDILEGVSIAARYRYEVERSHKSGYHSRVDEWNVVTSINPGDRIDIGVPLNFGLSRGSAIYFIRQFKTKKEAIKAKPYTPLSMPYNAQQAIEKLKVGDFVSLPTRMTFSVGSSKAVETLDGTISSHYMLSGQFILNIIRMDKNKVQVRVIAQNGKNIGGGGRLGFSFKAFEIVIKDKALEKVIDLDLAKLGFSKGKGNQFVLDYIYDLNNPEAAKAYEKLLSSSLKFKDFDLLKDYMRNKDIEDTVVASFAASDFLHLVDRNRKEKRVVRLFKGFNNFNTSKLNLGFNIKLARMKKNRTLSKNILVEEKDSKRKDYYLFHNYAVNQNHAYGIWPLRIKERKYSNIFALLEVDKDLQTKERYPDIGQSYDLRDMRLGDRERRALLGHIHKNLPSSVRERINWLDWKEDDKRYDALLFINMIINRKAFQEIPTMTRDELHLRLKQYRSRVRDEVGRHAHTFHASTKHHKRTHDTQTM